MCAETVKIVRKMKTSEKALRMRENQEPKSLKNVWIGKKSWINKNGEKIYVCKLGKKPKNAYAKYPQKK